MKKKSATFGKRLQKARKIKGLKQHEVASYLGMENQSSISKWESEDSRPNIQQVSKVAELLGVSPVWLAFGEESSAPTDSGREASKLIEQLPEYLQNTVLQLMRDMLRLPKQKTISEVKPEFAVPLSLRLSRQQLVALIAKVDDLRDPELHPHDELFDALGKLLQPLSDQLRRTVVQLKRANEKGVNPEVQVESALYEFVLKEPD